MPHQLSEQQVADYFNVSVSFLRQQAQQMRRFTGLCRLVSNKALALQKQCNRHDRTACCSKNVCE